MSNHEHMQHIDSNTPPPLTGSAVANDPTKVCTKCGGVVFMYGAEDGTDAYACATCFHGFTDTELQAQKAMDERISFSHADGLRVYPDVDYEGRVAPTVQPGATFYRSEWETVLMTDYSSQVNQYLVEMTMKCRRFEVAMVVLQMAARDVIAEEQQIGGTELRHSAGVKRLKEAIAALEALAPGAESRKVD